MKHLIAVLLVAAGLALVVVTGSRASAQEAAPQAAVSAAASPAEIALPAPITKGTMSLEEALSKRRSVRAFRATPLTQQQIGQLLWAAQGITDPVAGHRTAPSAMAVYPLTIYVLTEDGVFTYQPKGHRLFRLASEDSRASIIQVRPGQSATQPAPASFVVTGDPAKFGARASARAERWTALEAGHAAENLALEATALGLATVTQGGVNEAAVTKACALPAGTIAFYVMPVGYSAAR